MRLGHWLVAVVLASSLVGFTGDPAPTPTVGPPERGAYRVAPMYGQDPYFSEALYTSKQLRAAMQKLGEHLGEGDLATGATLAFTYAPPHAHYLVVIYVGHLHVADEVEAAVTAITGIATSARPGSRLHAQ